MWLKGTIENVMVNWEVSVDNLASVCGSSAILYPKVIKTISTRCHLATW